MREGDHKEGREAHSYTRPDGRNIDSPLVEDTSYNRHSDDIINKGPKKIESNEEITFLQETN